MILKKYFIFFIFFISQTSNANIFIVTSNADAGAGTLRQALIDVSTNGISLLDTIKFNITDTTKSGRTIELISLLPNLTSNLVIDASTQVGNSFGLSNAKIKLSWQKKLDFIFFNISNSSNIHLYGLFFNAIGTLDNIRNYWIDGINIKNSDSVFIGDINKGNYLNGLYRGILSDSSNYIQLKCNILGLDDNGEGTSSIYCNSTSISLQNTYHIIIGGDSSVFRNYIAAEGKCIGISFNPNTKRKNGNVFIENNFIGVNYSGTKYVKIYPIQPVSFSIDIEEAYLGDTTSGLLVEVKFNLVATIFLHGLIKPFKIVGNLMGVQANSISYLTNFPLAVNGTGIIFVSYCSKGDIGGDANKEKNIIANGNNGIDRTNSYRVNIKKNSIYCNTYSGINYFWYPVVGILIPPNYPFINITSIVGNTCFGNATPNSRIEIFASDSCNNCEGKRYLGSTISLPDGKWSFVSSIPEKYVATATNADSATSSFSKVIVSKDNLIIKNTACGKSTGSISGIKIISGTNITWYNSINQIIGTDTFINNLSAGIYHCAIRIGNNSCKETFSFTINNKLPIQSFNPIITNATCGLNTGSIKSTLYVPPSDSIYFAWFNAVGDTLSRSISIDSLFPGTYYFKSWIKFDTSCYKIFGPHNIINLSGPSINITNLLISDAICNNNNGSIKNMILVNTIGNIYKHWENLQGNIVTSNIDLLNAPSGKYRFVFKDGSSCDTIKSSYFTINNLGIIVIDTSNIKVNPSSCTINTGSISNIITQNASFFYWIDAQSLDTISNTINLQNAKAGTYILSVTNAFGCVRQITNLKIPQASFNNIGITEVITQNASCNINNGFVKPLKFTNDTSIYTFKWIDSSSGWIIGTHTFLYKINNGTYFLEATDSLGCKKIIVTSNIIQLGLPKLDASIIIIENDTCNLLIGNIRNVLINGGAGSPYTYSWYNNSTQQVSQQKDLLSVSTGQYYLIAKDKLGCEIISKPYNIYNSDIALLAPQVKDTFGMINTSVLLTIKNMDTKLIYLWYDNINNSPLHQGFDFNTPPIIVTKTYYIKNKKGSCESPFSKIIITKIDKLFISLPNVFSPNNDGVNDFLSLNITGVFTLTNFQLYNRFGQQVYKTNNSSFKWDGKLNGNYLPIGVYYWILNGIDVFNKHYNISGSVTILK